MDEIALPPKAFKVMVAVAWIDGRLDPQEVEAIRRAAEAEGLNPDEVAEVEQSLKNNTPLDEADLTGLGTKQRLYLYAMATWVATLSFGINEAERSVLEAIRDRLKLTKAEGEAMDEALCDLLLKPQGMRPARFDFAGLRQAIADRVDAASAWTPVKGTPAQ